MATIIENISPDYLTHEGWTSKRESYKFKLPVTLATDEIFIISDFDDRTAEAIIVSNPEIVKVNSLNVDTPIVAGDNLNGYRIGFKSTSGDAIGTDIDETLDYYSAI